jgi:predicted nucleotidyltransferase
VRILWIRLDARLCYVGQVKRDDAISRLRAHEAELERLGVERLYLFGSTARGEATDESDVDLFLTMKKASSACSN